MSWLAVSVMKSLRVSSIALSSYLSPQLLFNNYLTYPCLSRYSISIVEPLLEKLKLDFNSDVPLEEQMEEGMKFLRQRCHDFIETAKTERQVRVQHARDAYLEEARVREEKTRALKLVEEERLLEESRIREEEARALEVAEEERLAEAERRQNAAAIAAANKVAEDAAARKAKKEAKAAAELKKKQDEEVSVRVLFDIRLTFVLKKMNVSRY